MHWALGVWKRRWTLGACCAWQPAHRAFGSCVLLAGTHTRARARAHTHTHTHTLLHTHTHTHFYVILHLCHQVPGAKSKFVDVRLSPQGIVKAIVPHDTVMGSTMGSNLLTGACALGRWLQGAMP